MIKFKNEPDIIGIGSFEKNAKYGELLVLATSGSLTQEAIALEGLNNFSN